MYKTKPLVKVSSITIWEIAKYYVLGKSAKSASNNPSDKVKAQKASADAQAEGERLFKQFLNEQLTPNDKIRCETEFNAKYNNFLQVDWNKIPIAFTMCKYVKGQREFLDPIKREAVNSGGQTDFINPYAQIGSMARTASPDSVLSANVSMRGQNMTDARAGQVFDPERGMVVDTRGGTASPVMAGGVPIGPKDKALTDAQAKALLFSNRMEASDSIIGGLASGGTNATIPGMMGTGNANSIINAFAPADQQQLSQAKRDFVNAVLRRESGAVIAPSEFANADRQYFPQIGDSAQVRAQKAANRKAAIEGIKAEVPKTYAGPDRRAPSTGGTSTGFRVLGVERP